MYSVERQAKDIVYVDAEEGLSLRLPEYRFAGIVTPPRFSSPSSGFIDAAFDFPVKSPRLRNIATGRKKAVILVSDSTRSVPTAKVLPRIMKELGEAGMTSRNVSLVVAIGVHRRATEEEMREIVGEELWGHLRIENHDPYDPAKLVDLGETSFGTPVQVNRSVYEADLRIVVGKVEPHEFAGFSGGRKSVLPGISSEKTVEINHRPEMILHPKAVIGEWQDNPVSRDMAEAARMLGVDFCVNILVDPQNNPICVVCGDLGESHALAIEKIRESTGIPLKERPRIVVTTPGFPLNINFYQSMKAIIATAPVMAENGVIILYSRCAEGTGSDDMLLPFEKGNDIDDVLEFLFRHYRIQMDHALLLCKILQSGTRIVVVSPNISFDTIRKMRLLPAATLEEALKIASEACGDDEKILFFPCPQRTLPFISEERM